MKHRFRNINGQFITAYGFVQLLELKKVRYVDARGKRIRSKKSNFIKRVKQEHYQTREEIRQKKKYKKTKVKKKTGKKIEATEKPPEAIVIGPRGGQSIERIKLGNFQSYVRWGFLTKRITGSDGPSGRNAGVFSNNSSMEKTLEYTDFYHYFSQVRSEIESGELILLPESGIHYYTFREDANGYRHIDTWSERRVKGRDIFNV